MIAALVAAGLMASTLLIGGPETAPPQPALAASTDPHCRSGA